MRRMLRLRSLEERTGLGRSSIYRGMADGTFPRAARIGRRSVAWDATEIDAWIARRLAQRGGAR